MISTVTMHHRVIHNFRGVWQRVSATVKTYHILGGIFCVLTGGTTLWWAPPCPDQVLQQMTLSASSLSHVACEQSETTVKFMMLRLADQNNNKIKYSYNPKFEKDGLTQQQEMPINYVTTNRLSNSKLWLWCLVKNFSLFNTL